MDQLLCMHSTGAGCGPAALAVEVEAASQFRQHSKMQVPVNDSQLTSGNKITAIAPFIASTTTSYLPNPGPLSQAKQFKPAMHT
eukprot:4204145-Amphidinium_carterae.1